MLKYWQNLSVRWKLYIGYIALCLVVCIAGMRQWMHFRNIEKQKNAITLQNDIQNTMKEVKYWIASDYNTHIQLKNTTVRHETYEWWDKHLEAADMLMQNIMNVQSAIEDIKNEEYKQQIENVYNNIFTIRNNYENIMQPQYENIFTVKLNIITPDYASIDVIEPTTNDILAITDTLNIANTDSISLRDTIANIVDSTRKADTITAVSRTTKPQRTARSLDVQLKNISRERLIEKLTELSGALSDQTRDLTEKIRVSENLSTRLYQSLDKQYNNTITWYRVEIILTIIIFFVLVFFVGRRMAKNIIRSIDSLVEKTVQLSHGHINIAVQQHADNEFDELSQSIDLLAEKMRDMAKFAQGIGGNNFDTRHSFDTNSELGIAFDNMRRNLIQLSVERDQQIKRDQQQNWVTQGLAKFADILRQSNDVNKLADDFIINLVQYLEAAQGAVFLYNDQNPNDTFLEMSAVFAYDRKRYIKRKTKVSEGLVGMCAYEQKTLHITNLPQNYIKITSGLGGTNPNNLLLVPLIRENSLLGVLEISSMKSFEDYQIQFVERLAESTASTIFSAKINQQTERLLNATKIQSEELASQEEEMRQNVEELQAAQEEAGRKEMEMRGVLYAIDNSLLKLEISLAGKIISCNKRFAEVFDYRVDEIVGKHVNFFIPEAERNEFNQKWQKVCEGQLISATVKRKTKREKPIWLVVSYTPVMNDNMEIEKVLLLATLVHGSIVEAPNDDADNKTTKDKTAKK